MTRTSRCRRRARQLAHRQRQQTPGTTRVQDIPGPGLSAVQAATALPGPPFGLLRHLKRLRQPRRPRSLLAVGRLLAQVNQACVVTLEPVDSTIDEPFEAVFWPQERVPEPEKGELAIDSSEREPIVAGQKSASRSRRLREPSGGHRSIFPRKPGAGFAAVTLRGAAARRQTAPFRRACQSEAERLTVRPPISPTQGCNSPAATGRRISLCWRLQPAMVERLWGRPRLIGSARPMRPGGSR